MKKQYVADIKIGELIDDIFILAEKQISLKKDGNRFCNVRLGDKTGEVKGVMWDNVDKLFLDVSAGDFVLVQGYVGEYRETLQIVLKNISSVIDEKMIDSLDFLPISERNIDQMFSRLRSITDTINNVYIKHLFELFWEDACFVEQFKRAPAAKYLHHAYIGGLLEHTLSMAIVGEQVANHYSGVNRDLLLAGIVLHDVGKIKELSYRKKIDYTDEGRLLSHIVMGVMIVDEKINKIPDFPKQTEDLIKHLIVSHHGSKEFGSPEVPKTVEAILLNSIDDMDFKVNSVRDYIDSETTSSFWTPYNRIMERHFYKGGID